MSKRAEKRALELFPVDMQMCIDNMGEPYEADVNAPRRKYVAYGYEQAEKDLALTWEDIKFIIQTFLKSVSDAESITSNKAYKETLKRFNEQKKK